MFPLNNFLFSVKPALRGYLLNVLALALIVLAALPAFASTPTPTPVPTSIPTITIDPTPLFTSISTYVPMFFGILAVAGGILIGKRIAEYVIKAIADAF